LVIVTRDWLTTGTTTQAGAFVVVTLVVLMLLLAGWVTFRVAMPHLIARMGN
jgi:hypothetical protein